MNESRDSEFNEKRNSDLLDKIKAEFTELGHFLLPRLKSPYSLIGLAIILIAIIISIFPQILTPYSYTEATGIFPGAWAPPSFEHLLGQARYGRDVLARIIYGISDALLFCSLSVLVGLVSALIIGVPINYLNKQLNISAEIILAPIFMIPLPLLFIYTFFIFPGFFLYFFYGIYLIPVFIYLIVKENLSIYEIGQKLIPYIPLIIGFTILIYTLIGFLGFVSFSGIQIGYDIASARVNFIDAPWAFIFPNLAIIILLFGFFLLYAGLQKSPEEMQELKRA